MNVEDFKKMSLSDQLYYVFFQEDGENFREYFDVESLTGRDWAFWITMDADRINDCPLKKLTPSDWAHILATYPDLVSEFQRHYSWNDFNGSDWAAILPQQPDFAEYCEWSKLEFKDWLSLYSFTDEFHDKCPFEYFEPEEVDQLVRLFPELTPYSGLIDPQLLYIVNEQPIISEEEYDKDDDDIPIRALPRLPETPDSKKLSETLRLILGYSASEANKKTENIRHYNESLVAVYAREYAASQMEQLTEALKHIKLPLTCIAEPFNIELFE